ncbi:S8 family peptidase [Marvinbryantia formatexigens]|nr:S8 family peptidase [Marvinbryantia formatexigens]UWO24430.1 S8 family peptidase [Marvinbryantia formatexigens DSM 14469]SDF07315.1 Subtilase family protein [Marvinbryantia formatexigens]
MPEPSLQDKIYSNDYFDAILPVTISSENFLEAYAHLGAQLFGARFGMVHLRNVPGSLPQGINYSLTPKLFTTLDTTSLEVSGILRVQTQPSLGYRGKDILLGFLDTGIDYTRPAFRTLSGDTRILGIWDQTRPSASPPFDMGYGTGYTSEDINRALRSDNPYEIVPQKDEDGHGTFVAGVAAGSEDISGEFTGAAPACKIAAVKLKPAKQNLRDYFLVREGAVAFQESDIMMGLRYLLSLAASYSLPLVICISLGTNQGDHSGNSPLERYLSFILDYLGCFCTAAAGNETGLAHHFYQAQSPSMVAPGTELLIDEDTDGVFLEIWADSPDLYGVSITSPLGETIPRIPPRPGTRSTYSFIAERTVLEVSYEIAEYTSGAQLIVLRFLKPTPGIWRISVSSTQTPLGSFHMWLPVDGFLSPGTVFLDPDPYTTLTVPSTDESVITVSTYDAYTGSLFINSGRGNTRTGMTKPDITAPGVSVYGPASASGNLPPLNPYIRRTGSSAAAAITAGAVALLLNWNQDQPSPQFITNRSVKDYLTRGAVRQRGVVYPNREWGYGTLNLYRIFETLM